MKRIALLKDNIVTNIAVWDGTTEWDPITEFMIDVTDITGVDIGATFDGENFISPSEDDG